MRVLARAEAPWVTAVRNAGSQWRALGEGAYHDDVSKTVSDTLITMSQDQDGISLPVPAIGACPGRERPGGESASGGGGGGGIPAAGTFWHDSVVSAVALSPTVPGSPVDGGGLLSTGKSSKSRPVTVAYVLNGEASQQNNAESMALQCLRDACDTVGSKLETVNFSKLDFGETTVLDSFYNAGGCKCRRLLGSPTQKTSLVKENLKVLYHAQFTLAAFSSNSVFL